MITVIAFRDLRIGETFLLPHSDLHGVKRSTNQASIYDANEKLVRRETYSPSTGVWVKV